MFCEVFSKSRRSLASLAILGWLMLAAQYCHAQAVQKPVAPGELVAELQKAETVDKALAMFQPPLAKAQLTKSDYLLLDVPPIALPGKIQVRLMSELPGTELFVLFNNKAQPKEPAVLVAKLIPSTEKSDVRVEITLDRTTELLLLAKAGGRYYSVTREVKIAAKEVTKETGKPASKQRR